MAPATGTDPLTLSLIAAKGLAETLSLMLPLLNDPLSRDKARSTIFEMADTVARLHVVTQLYEAVLAGDLDRAENIQTILAGNHWPPSLLPKKPN